MKIAMLTNNYRPFVGGVPISVERQAQELIQQGNEVTVFAPRYEGQEEGETLERIVRYHTRKRRMDNGMVYPGLLLDEIQAAFRRENFDVIHVHHPMFVGPWALYLGRKYQIPVIYTYHTRYEDYLHYLPWLRQRDNSPAFKKRILAYIREKLVPGYMRWFTNQCDMVIAPSEGMKDRIRSEGTWTPIEVLPTGLKDEFFQPDPKRSQKIRDQYLRDGEFLFCTVSRLEKEKNLEFLFRGAAEIKKRCDQAFKVLVIGDGREKEALQILAENLGISQEIVFVGNVANEDVKNYLHAADLFLFASKSETQGIVLAEALAAGTPVVAVKATGVDDIVKDAQNGYRTSENIEEWSQKALLALKPGIRERMEARARSTAEGYRASEIARHEKNLYVQCILKKESETRALRMLEEGWAYRERGSRI